MGGNRRWRFECHTAAESGNGESSRRLAGPRRSVRQPQWRRRVMDRNGRGGIVSSFWKGKRNRPSKPTACRTCSSGRSWKTGSPNSGSAPGATDLFVRQRDLFQSPEGLDNPAAAVLALYQDRQGAMWVGTQSGLARWSNGQCTWFTRKEGLMLPDVRAITEAADGTLWFGMSGGGLGRLKEGKLTQFRSQAGLANDFVWSLLAEPMAPSGWVPLAAACAVCGMDGSQPFPSAKVCRIMSSAISPMTGREISG